MRVLMLGWEFPPFITGGLGTACHGLTRALDRRGVEICFVLPKAVDESAASHVKLLSPDSSIPYPAATPGRPRSDAGGATENRGHDAAVEEAFRHVDFIGIPAGFANPYERPAIEGRDEESASEAGGAGSGPSGVDSSATEEALREATTGSGSSSAGSDEGIKDLGYGGDLFRQVQRYARFCLAATLDEPFDVIHAHDWMTYPAGLAIARISGRPLVVHVHSTEFDRSGADIHQGIYDIERRGMHGAMRVITVSQLTKNTVMSRYGVPDHRAEVVYNGVDIEPGSVGMTGIQRRDKIVLYFGRITFQKGPEYFLRAAQRVLEKLDNVKFVVAGSGDMATRMIEMAATLKIGHKVLFTGFLRGDDIKRVFSMADLYVMPSVSEPFGIAPLEAMSHDVPALISKSSGVSEVLTHALKVDFWDIDDMANKIVAVLRHPPLSRTLREQGRFEVRRLTWDGAAQRCEQVYQTAIDHMQSVHAAPV